ncbi:MAG: caspase family protein, partial [Nostocales cyanobacterium 94392]|nr:caspase family protein [Nostocales cyanobacterium 94392]
HFLQFAGSTLSAITLSQSNFTQQAHRYAQVIAQNTPRKLALLVGINSYPSGIGSLKGCLSDVEMQYELLVHRFGFNPKDIVVITDEADLKPTRQNILDQFQTHLIDQAEPGDVVVFHFSGHGSRIIDPYPIPELIINGEVVPNTDKLNGTLVPRDRNTKRSDIVQDIMGRSLFLLMYALKTNNVTAILDSCHSGGGTRGDLVFRAVSSRLDSGESAKPSETELEFQRRWMKDLQLSEAKLYDMRRKGIAKGVAIGSAQFDQLAAEAKFDNDTFHCGAFTYILTRYLWQASSVEGIGNTFVNLERSTNDLAIKSSMYQTPIIAANPETNSQKPTFFLNPVKPWAEAIVRKVKPGGEIEYWLGGISALSLEAKPKGIIWALINTKGQEIGEIEQQDRKGLVGYGKLTKGESKNVQPGVLLREKIRGIPENLKLRVGLDVSLGEQLEIARASLASIDRIEVVSTGAEYILGRMTSSYLQQVKPKKIRDLPAVDSFGLFLPGLTPLANTFQKSGESASSAVERLQGRLISLLAGKLLKLITGSDAAFGGNSTKLNVTTAIIPKGSSTKTTPSQFLSGTDVQVKVRNNEKNNLYIAVISIGSSGKITPLFPYWNSAEIEAILAPQQEIITPQESDGYSFKLKGVGSQEILVLASFLPIRDALKGLKSIADITNPGGRTPVNIEGEQALGWVQELLGDLERNTRSIRVESSGDRIVAKSQLAAISTIINVVES